MGLYRDNGEEHGNCLNPRSSPYTAMYITASNPKYSHSEELPQADPILAQKKCAEGPAFRVLSFVP